MMKLAIAACVLLLSLQLPLTGSTGSVSPDQESGELCALLEKLLQVKDKTVTREMKILLKALIEAFSQCKNQLITTTAATDMAEAPIRTSAPLTPTPTQPEKKTLTTTATMDTATAAPSATTTLPPSANMDQSQTYTSASSATAILDKHLVKTTTSAASTSTPVSTTTSSASSIPPLDAKRQNHYFREPPKSGSTPESTSAHDNGGKEETQGSSKSDRKFLWIILGVLGALMLVTILILKSKVLICTRIHTNADVANYMEEKMYSKNDDIVLLGVTPGAEGEDDYYFCPKGSPGYEDISPRSTY